MSEQFFIQSLREMGDIAARLENQAGTLDDIASSLERVRKADGRVFFCGVGG